MKKILLPFLALAMVMFMDSCQTSKHGKYQVPNLRWHSGILSYEITSVSVRRLNDFSHESVIRPCSL